MERGSLLSVLSVFLSVTRARSSPTTSETDPSCVTTQVCSLTMHQEHTSIETVLEVKGRAGKGCSVGNVGHQFLASEGMHMVSRVLWRCVGCCTAV